MNTEKNKSIIFLHQALPWVNLFNTILKMAGVLFVPVASLAIVYFVYSDFHFYF